MGKNKTEISGADTYQAIGEFWDNHDLTEVWDQTEPADFEVKIETVRRYYPINSDLSNKIAIIAQKKGVSTETLLNLWIQEKINQTKIEQ